MKLKFVPAKPTLTTLSSRIREEDIEYKTPDFKECHVDA